MAPLTYPRPRSLILITSAAQEGNPSLRHERPPSSPATSQPFRPKPIHWTHWAPGSLPVPACILTCGRNCRINHRPRPPSLVPHRWKVGAKRSLASRDHNIITSMAASFFTFELSPPPELSLRHVLKQRHRSSHYSSSISPGTAEPIDYFSPLLAAEKSVLQQTKVATPGLQCIHSPVSSLGSSACLLPLEPCIEYQVSEIRSGPRYIPR